MASWLKRGASAALVLSAALVCPAVADKPTVTGCTESCLLTANLARSGRLNERLPTLTKDAAVENAVTQLITTDNLGGDDTSTCTVSANATPTNAKVQGVVVKIPQATAFNCPGVINQLVKDGLAAITNYTEQAWDDGKAAPYNTPAAQNLAFLMYPKASGIGCSVTSGCTAGELLFMCKLNPSLSASDTAPPFTAKFFDALKARQAKGVDLSTLGAGDVNTDADGNPASSAAIMAIPGAIPAAAFTFSSLLGFASTIHQ